MNSRPRLSAAAATFVLILMAGAARPARAGMITVDVGSHEGPWSYANGGLNTGFQYGIDDQTGPVIIGAADGFSFAPGGVFTLQYLSGTTRAGSSFPNVDANGDLGLLVNNGRGSSGKHFPSFYFDHADYPTYLSELVGTFANDSGAIVGTPFAIGDMRSVVIPEGATRLQLGINDDIFHDNSGSLVIRVIGPSAVPEPASLVILGCGAVGVLGYARRRKVA